VRSRIGPMSYHDVLRDGRILLKQASHLSGSPGNVPCYATAPELSLSLDTEERAGRHQLAQAMVFTHGDGLAALTSPLAHEQAIAAPLPLMNGIAELPQAIGCWAHASTPADTPSDFQAGQLAEHASTPHGDGAGYRRQRLVESVLLVAAPAQPGIPPVHPWN